MLCINDKETQDKFDALASVVGEKEAWRDFFEQDGVVRPPKLVLKKIEERDKEVALKPFFTDDFFLSDEEYLTKSTVEAEKIVADYNKEVSTQAIEKFSKALNIPYNIVSEEDAFKLTSEKNIKGFFYKGEVFFVKGKFDETTLFHEFSHPLIKSLIKDNFSLAKKLFDEVEESVKQKILSKYPELSEDLNRFMEEVLVTKMTTLSEKETTTPDTWGSRLYYAIKKILRNIFGSGIKVHNLKASTTLNDLINILNSGEQVFLNKSFLNQQIVAEFQKDYEDLINDIENSATLKAEEIIKEYYDLINRQVSSFTKQNDIFINIAADLVNEDNDEILQNVRKALDAIVRTRYTKPRANETEDEKVAREVNQRIKVYVEQVSKADIILNRFEEKISDLEKNDFQSMKDFDTLMAIETFVQDWSYFIANLNRKVGSNSFGELVNKLDKRLNQQIEIGSEKAGFVKRIQELKERAVLDKVVSFIHDSFKDELANLNSKMDEAINNDNYLLYSKLHQEYYGITPDEKLDLEDLENIPEDKRTEAEQYQYSDLKLKSLKGMYVTREALKERLSGNLGEVKWMNDFFITRMQSQDPSIGAFYKFITEQLMEVNGTANGKAAEFDAKLETLLTEAGEKNYVLGESGLGERLVQITTTLDFKKGSSDEETFQKYEYMQAFNGWQEPLQRLMNNSKLAKELYDLDPSNSVNKSAYYKARKELRDFQLKYMNQRYVDEFYELDSLLGDDELGEEIREMLDELYLDINVIQGMAFENQQRGDFTTNLLLKQKLQELDDLHRVYVNGVKKQGKDLEIAERLSQYRKEKQKFYKWKIDNDSFDKAYVGYQNYLIHEKGYLRGTDQFEAALNLWLEDNTIIELDEEYVERRANLMAERKAILAPYHEKNKDIVDTTELYEKMYSILRRHIDPQGQYDATDLTDDEQEEVKNLQQQIEDAKHQHYDRRGLTGQERDELDNYFNMIRSNQGIPEVHKTRYRELLEKYNFGLKEFGISEDDLRRLYAIENELFNQTRTDDTTHYQTEFLNFLEIEEVYKTLSDYFTNKYNLDIDNNPPTTYHFKEMLEDLTFIDKLLTTDDTFKKWFERNHYKASVIKKDGKGNIIGKVKVWKKTPAWLHTVPEEPITGSNIKARYNLNEKGSFRGMGTLQLYGINRMPNMSYRNRVVKEEFENEIIERDYIDEDGDLVLATVDNRGNYLPKLEPTNAFYNKAYFDMFYKNRPLWNILDHIKNFKLDNQQQLDKSQRSYLDVPAIRKHKTEDLKGFFTAGYWERRLERTKDLFRSANDDVEIGIINASKNRNNYVTLTHPITGMYRLPINDVSLNVIRSEKEQMHSIELFKKLRSINSLAKGYKDLAVQLGMKIDNVNSNDFYEKLKAYRTVGGKNPQYQILEEIYDDKFRGEKLEQSKARVVAPKLLNKITGWSSFKFFFLNPISSFTNYFSGKLQLMYKAVDNRYYGPKDWLYGRRKAMSVMSSTTSDLYSKGSSHLQIQLLNIMDAVPTDAKRRIAVKNNRTLIQSIAEKEFGYADRKFLQNSVAVHGFYALLSANKIRIDGKNYSLDQLIELRQGKLHTKSNVPEEWSITYNNDDTISLGSKVKEVMLKHQDLLLKTTGIANEFNTPEMQRHYIFKFAFSMMRFLPGMTLDKWGYKKGGRLNYATQKREYGIFVEFMQTLGKIATLKPNEITRGQWNSTFQTVLGMTVSYILHFITQNLIFNDDDDDQNKRSFDKDAEGMYAFLKNTTSIPNLPYVRYDRKASRFDSEDFMKLQLLRLALRIERENNTFYPNNLAGPVTNLVTFNTPAQEGSLAAIRDLTTEAYNVFVKGDDLSVYTKKAGPYEWQGKDDEKWINMITNGLLGFSGKIIDPAFAIEQEQKILLK